MFYNIAVSSRRGRIAAHRPEIRCLISHSLKSHAKSETASLVVLATDHSSDSRANARRFLHSQRAEAASGVQADTRSVRKQSFVRSTRTRLARPATVFQPSDPLMTPDVHFPLQTVTERTRYPRFVNRFNSREIMLVVDGSCINNGSRGDKNHGTSADGNGREPSAGASVIFKKTPGHALCDHATTIPMVAIRGDSSATARGTTILTPEMTGKIALRLERNGPRGDCVRNTSNRAKLCAVIAALDFCLWSKEGWEKIVIVTDLEYIAIGATKWLPIWLKRRWESSPKHTGGRQLRAGKEIVNRDLWEELQSRVEMLGANGTEIAFWLVSLRSPVGHGSELMKVAKAAAREAARANSEIGVDEYTRLCGLFV